MQLSVSAASGEAPEPENTAERSSPVPELPHYSSIQRAFGRRGAAPQSSAVQRKPAAPTPAKQSDFVIPLPQDSFTVSFALVSPEAGAVRVAIAPANFSRAYQSEMKYWDVKGREVDKDDSYVSMGNWSVPAQPNQQVTKIAAPAKFDPIDLKRIPESSGTVWTFDLDGDGKPDFCSAHRIQDRQHLSRVQLHDDEQSIR